MFKTSAGRSPAHRPLKSCGAGLRRAVTLAAACGAAALQASAALAAADYHLYTLPSDGSQGSLVTALANGNDGAFYGAAEEGASLGGTAFVGGTIFRLGLDGSATTIYTFGTGDWSGSFPLTDSDGIFPEGLVLGGDGALYGIASEGGTTGGGTVFRLTKEGGFSLLHTFDNAGSCECQTNNGGAFPSAIVPGQDGALYGITRFGGANGAGSFFRVALDGTYSDLYDFSTVQPNVLIAGHDGNFYGYGGQKIPGSGNAIFKLTPDGSYSVVHLLGSTLASEGAWVGAMVHGTDGNLYLATGTNEGDPAGNGGVLRLGLDGTVTMLHSFSPILTNLVWQGVLYGGWVRKAMNLNQEGAGPVSLVQAADGTLYGALLEQGPDSGGSVFSMTTDGNFSVLHTYGNNTPEASASPLLMADAGDGSMIVATNNNALFNLQPSSPVSVTAAFNPSTISLYQSSRLSWSSTGAASCKISGDYVKTLKTATATSGTRTVWTYSTKTRLPAQFFAVVNCVSADGKTVANTTATLTVQ